MSELWKQRLPMQLTWLRMGLTLPILLAMIPNHLGWNVCAIVIFIVASITDYYDGYFARKFNAVSNMGKFMDPIADKILVSSILIALLSRGSVDPWMVMIVIVRDTLIGGIRSVAAADQIVIAAKSAGKWKTALQMGAIPAVILGTGDWLKIGYAVLWLTVVLSVASGIQYYLVFEHSRRQPKS